MRIVDSRSGREVKLGEVVTYPEDRYSWRLLGAVQLSFGVARFTVQLPTGQVSVVDGPIRRTHPRHFLQKVAFLPT
jgi:hypothetical protein